MKSVILLQGRRVLWRSALAAFLVASSLLLVSITDAGAANPIPQVNQPLVPASIAPGGPEFTLTVNGTGFVSGSVVNWNGSALATSFISDSQLTATVPATDIAVANTASITVVNSAPVGGTSNEVFFSITLPTSSVAFSRSDVATASGPETVATGDFNGDGKLDLAVGVYGSAKVSILLGNGDGTFQAHVDYATSSLPSSVVARDFNGDGKLDLAVLNQGSGTISVFLGKGDGTFQSAVPFAVLAGCGRMIAADFNGDGKLDLATTNDSRDIVSILLGNGDGTFQGHVDYTTGSVPFPIAVGDLNGDGKLDLVVGNVGASTFSVLLGNGDGTFQNHVDYPTITDPTSVVLADFNGDGKMDLAVFSFGDGTRILLGNGDGTFRDFADYTTGCGGGNDCTAAVGDLNGDGKLDLAVRLAPAAVSVFLGNGDGTFQRPVSFPTGSNPNQVTIGDFNGDGKLDLAAANLNGTTVSILLQTTGGPEVTLTPTSLTFTAQPVGTLSPAQQATLTNTGGAALKITSIRPTGDFAFSCNCPFTLAAGASCTLKVRFFPTSAPGTRRGTVTLKDNAPGSPHKLQLSGTASGSGSIILALSPSSLDFGSVAVGSSSDPQTVTVTNNGTVAASLVPPLGLFIKGTNGMDFHLDSQCGTSLAPQASCTATVTFKPRATGSRTGLFIARQGAATVQIPLSGTGT